MEPYFTRLPSSSLEGDARSLSSDGIFLVKDSHVYAALDSPFRLHRPFGLSMSRVIDQ